MGNRFFITLAVVILAIVGVFAFTKKSGPNGSTASSNAQPTNHLEGSDKNGVVLVEYGDYQCPYCGAYYPTIKEVASKYNDKIQFQFRNLPLIQLHPNAFAAARAAEAASLQNKFWEMHDLIYETQSNWASGNGAQGIFEGYATQLGLNVAQFKTDYASSKVNDIINADIDAFLKTGQGESTPSFFLDGQKVSPTNTVDSFVQLIDAELAKKQPAAKP